MKTGRVRVVAAAAATAAVLGPLGWLWQASLPPDTYSVMDMGHLDTGGGPSAAHGHGGRLVTELRVDPSRPADVAVTLTARRGTIDLGDGRRVAGYTLNGASPGPTIRAVAGQLVEVTAVNESVPDGIALHWHGVAVPNAADGVAGVTQDAIGVGRSFTYRFVVDRPGTYWYHAHQLSHEQVRLGLLGALVVDPAPGRAPTTGERPVAADVVALVHNYGDTATLGGRPGTTTVAAAPGSTVRVRVVNTDNGTLHVWVGGPLWALLAVDGNDVHRPGELQDVAVGVPAGGRVDLAVTAPSRVEIGNGVAVAVGAPVPPVARPATTLDLLHYGAPQALSFDPERADRHFRYDIGRRPGFLHGRPGAFWTVNGHLDPYVPMFLVREGETVRVTMTNSSGETHPMHLHGHRVVVLARNGATATGSPWWTDTLDVGPGETYEVAFVADNPGIWMDHCHNLPHAVDGLVAHLVYEGVTTPFLLAATGNTPE